MKNVFSFRDYKQYLQDVEEMRKGYERGFRSKLATYLSCQSGYISHVLNGNSHFSLEQTMRLAHFLSLNPRERKYLLLLVEWARAGTEELKSHFDGEIRNLKEEHLNIKERVGASNTLTVNDQSVYYSSWQYLAVHVLVSLSGYNDAKSISQALKIPEDAVGRVLLFLIKANIVTESRGTLRPGLTQVHLNRESPLIRQHHTNWRIAAIQSLMNDNKSDIHYSTVSTMSKGDAENLRAGMAQFIEGYVAAIKPSMDEVMFGFNLDFYSLIKK